MYPPQFNPEGNSTGEAGELIVYEFLRDNMPDDWIAIHDLWRNIFVKSPGKDTHYNYEADFVLLIPGKGCMVLEVKNIHEIWIEDGQWKFKGSKGEAMDFGRKNSPIQQASRAATELHKSLHRLFDKNIVEVRHMALLLQQNRSDFGSLDDKEDDLCIFGKEEMLDGMQQRIERLFIYHNAFGEAEMEKVREYLLRSVIFKMSSKSGAELIERASEPLKHILPLLEKSKGRIRIDGCAGSGKTWMAVREAARLAERASRTKNGQRILMLCYNRLLCITLKKNARLRSFASGYNSPLEIHAILDYFAELVKQKGEAFDWTDPYQCLENRKELLAEQLAKKRFDYIFVDEAQDFDQKCWPLLAHALKPDGLLYLFSDSNQSLYREKEHVPPVDTRITLTRNLRNSKQIALYSSAILPQAHNMQPLLLEGYDIILKSGSDSPEERAETVSHLLAGLSKKIAPQDIVILSPWKKKEKSSLYSIPGVLPPPAEGEETPQQKEKRYNDWRNGHGVLGETIKSFKGLESLVVILVDIPDLEEAKAFTRNDFYVACTRAKFALYIVPSCSGHDLASELKREIEQAN